MFDLITVGVVSVLAIGSVLYSWISERRQWQEERKDLLNRIMSRDYQEYAAQEVNKTELLRVVPIEDLRRELMQEQRESLGMPV